MLSPERQISKKRHEEIQEVSSVICWF